MADSLRYPIPADRCRAEESIDRSRFICTIARAETPDAAQDFIRAITGEFNDATHNCWAYVAGAPGSTAHVGMSDDGEPHGTAARPMLTVLLHSGVGEIVAVVTRYYGGTKLGTLPALEAQIVSDAFADRVTLTLRVPVQQLNALRTAIGNATSGQAVFTEDRAPS